jgi:hypothetical protein
VRITLLSFSVFHLTTCYLTPPPSYTTYVHSLFRLFPCRSPLMKQTTPQHRKENNTRKEMCMSKVKARATSVAAPLIRWLIGLFEVRPSCVVDMLLSHSFLCVEDTSCQRRKSVSSATHALYHIYHSLRASCVYPGGSPSPPLPPPSLPSFCLYLWQTSHPPPPIFHRPFTRLKDRSCPLHRPAMGPCCSSRPLLLLCWIGGSTLVREEQNNEERPVVSRIPQISFVCCVLWRNKMTIDEFMICSQEDF